MVNNFNYEQLNLLTDLSDGHSFCYLQQKHGVDRETLYTWLRQAHFDQEYIEQLNITTQLRLNSLIQHVDSAIRELGLLLEDEKPEIKLKAIEIILKYSDRIEKANLNHRLNTLMSRINA